MTIEAAFFGTVAKDTEPKISAKGKPWIRIVMRVGDGDDAQWIIVAAFGDVATALGHVTKGSRLYVEGKLTQETWTGKDGAERRGLSVAAWKCHRPEIGRNKPKRKRETKPTSVTNEPPPFNDAIGF